MKSKSIILATLLFAVTAFAADYSTWTKYKSITLSPTGMGLTAAVTNIPVLVRLSAANAADVFTGSLSTNGADIRFTQSNGTTDLPFQIESWNTTSQVAAIWVLLPSVASSGSTTVRMYWGKSAQTTTSSGSAVFSTANGYQAAFHMNEAANDTLRDATANGFKGLPLNKGGTNPRDTAGVVGRAKSFLGSNANNNGGSYRLVTSTGGNTQGGKLNFQNDSSGIYTLSAWVYMDNFPNGTATRKGIISKSKGVNGSQYHLRTLDPAVNQLNSALDTNRIEFADGPNAQYRSGTTRLTTGAWFHVVAVRKGPVGTAANLAVYVNGGNVATSSTSITPTTGSAYSVYIGSYGNDSGYFGGRIDEVSFSNSARDANWIKLSYETQKAAATAVTLGTTVTQSTPAPSALTYTKNPLIAGVAKLITPDTAKVTGAVTSYSISPALPTGLALNTTNGIITGTPTAVKAASNYLITATNASGSTTVTLSISVLAVPTALTYTRNPLAAIAGAAITPDTAKVTGTITSYSISPALPTGFVLNTTTGIITGTATAVKAASNYVVTATNVAGSTAVTLSISVAAGGPSALTYTKNPLIAGVAKLITPDTAKVTGTVTSYSITPALPTGLTLNTTSGIITGTATAAKAASNYTVTATNASGSTTVVLSITVLAVPAALTYTKNPLIGGVAKLITPDTAKVTGTVTSYSVSPALPTGLTLNTTSGIITGTATAVKAASNYVVTATNVAGSTTVTLSITVLAIPSALTYTKNPLIAGVAKLITPDTAKVTGTVTAYSVSPVLPTGLTLNATTGIITGTATAAKAASNYVITATNVAGSATVTLSITVLAAPTNLAYMDDAPTYLLGTSITPNTPTVTGTVTQWTVSPALPTGLLVNATTGILSGTPTVARVAANYTITAVNVAGSTTFVIYLTTAILGKKSVPGLKAYPGIFALRLSGATPISIALPADGSVGEVQISLMDMWGRTIGTNSLVLGYGTSELAWNLNSYGRTLSKGIYVARIRLLDQFGKTVSNFDRQFAYAPR